MAQRILTIVIIIAVLAGGGYYSYTNFVTPVLQESDEGPIYATTEVEQGDITVDVQGFGPLQPIYSEQIQMPIEGTIDSVSVERGDDVTEGQVVAQINSQPVEQEIENIQDDLEDTRREAANLLGVSPAQLENVDPERGISITAPVSGRVSELNAAEGERISEGQVVAKVVDRSAVLIEVGLNPGQYEQVSEGDEASFDSPEFAGEVEGTVSEVSSVRIPREDHFEYEAVVEFDNPGLLRPGISGTVAIQSSDGEVRIGGAEITSFRQEDLVVSGIAAQVVNVPVSNGVQVEAGDIIVGLGGAATETSVEDLLAEISDLENDIAEQEELLEQLEITSPFTGQVANSCKSFCEGREMSQGDQIVGLFDGSRMNLNIQVDELDIPHVEEGQDAEITVDAIPGETFQGTVQRVDMRGQTEEGIAQFGVLIEVEATEALQPGMTANANIHVDSKEDVSLVPVEAIFQEDGDSRVEVMGDDDQPHAVTIETGLINDRWAEVTSGLDEGQLVVTGSSFDAIRAEQRQQQEDQEEGGDEPALPGGQPGGDDPAPPVEEAP